MTSPEAQTRIHPAAGMAAALDLSLWASMYVLPCASFRLHALYLILSAGGRDM